MHGTKVLIRRTFNVALFCITGSRINNLNYMTINPFGLVSEKKKLYNIVSFVIEKAGVAF